LKSDTCRRAWNESSSIRRWFHESTIAAIRYFWGLAELERLRYISRKYLVRAYYQIDFGFENICNQGNKTKLK